ncbi:NAD(P)-dependent dehydrogenase, short-chain alcohol dehydrogenase family [Fulvimarina manganoxydans]|uniref:NAD(P)-dependent dehydrogenase, short-chain alcohol dehydrogenase family n=1 Tax=Fulvimarina manganoxydans TaxID=937218 RepID=A0A1W2A1R7_9HYPH|nr:SDR family oxidoreductase [Fulvimarina manganoxydans]SMC54604.1 NAD(P)-dependent dehydrogenase, short-chain alcohol dehydrogenase family [Fulvimarina manganoxydans]
MIVTGGSRGIGAATARLAAERGYAVVVNYVSNKTAAEDVVASIKTAGGSAIAVKGDVAEERDVLHLFEAADRFGRLSGLVNNAGIVYRAQTVAEMDIARIDRMMRVNVTGSILCAREAVRRMSKSRGGEGGAIVSVSSVAAKLGGSGQYVDYAASKGAIDTFTVGLAKEVVEEDIRVYGVRPGIIDTEIHASGGQPHRVADLAPTLPMKRAGTAEEVAKAILWLASSEASYSTGAILDVSGARSILP